MISVALCTYNGAQYIKEQVKSILNQTLPVDEIVVCDDGGNDETLTIIEGLQSSTDTIIRIYRNEKKLGVCANFQQAINLCRGDIIFLADQDDIWHREKVSTIVNYMQDHPSTEVLFTDACLIDQNGDAIAEHTLWQCFGMTPYAQRAITNGFGLELFANGNRATGATMALRATSPFCHNFIRYCIGDVLHDYALALLALSRNTLGYIPLCLIDYRLHSKQQNGVGLLLEHPWGDSYVSSNGEAVELKEYQLPDPIGPRIDFFIARSRNQHRWLGLIHIIGAFGRYHHIYGALCCATMRRDVRIWGHNMIHRFF